MNRLSKYSLGIGDRFALQGDFQLEAILAAYSMGREITPVWNKSFREHKTVGSEPLEVRKEADLAVKELGWQRAYFVDADHIREDTVEEFIACSDFFTIDVADKIGIAVDQKDVEDFLSNHDQLIGDLFIKGIQEPFILSRQVITGILNKFYQAAKEAGRIYRKIKKAKKDKYFAIEVSMDEVDEAQTPEELFFILLLLAENEVPLNTIAPKFTGEFLKGVDYLGVIDEFGREFEKDLLVIKHAIGAFGFPSDLKLSIHTGSDKFSLYPEINKIIKRHDAGIHLKTAGTTWLEELVGIAETGGTGLALAKSIYFEAVVRFDELITPYGSVVQIDRTKLPSGNEVKSWDSSKFCNAINHNQTNINYNPNMRQLLHTAYKIAAEKKEIFRNEIRSHRELIGGKVKSNLLNKHMVPLFINEHGI